MSIFKYDKTIENFCVTDKYNDDKEMRIIKYKYSEEKFKESIKSIEISQLIFKNCNDEHEFTEQFERISGLLNGTQFGGGNNYIFSLKGRYIDYVLKTACELFIIIDDILRKKEEINTQDINTMYILYILLKYIKRNPDILDSKIDRLNYDKEIDCYDYETFSNIILIGWSATVKTITSKYIESEGIGIENGSIDCTHVEKHKYLKYKLKYLQLKKIKNLQ